MKVPNVKDPNPSLSCNRTTHHWFSRNFLTYAAWCHATQCPCNFIPSFKSVMVGPCGSWASRGHRVMWKPTPAKQKCQKGFPFLRVFTVLGSIANQEEMAKLWSHDSNAWLMSTSRSSGMGCISCTKKDQVHVAYIILCGTQVSMKNCPPTPWVAAPVDHVHAHQPPLEIGIKTGKSCRYEQKLNVGPSGCQS